MPKRIEVGLKITDSRANSLLSKINKEFNFNIEKISLIEVFTVDSQLSNSNFDILKKSISNSLIEDVRCEESLNNNLFFDFALEVGFLPGVTDNEASTFKEIIKDSIGEDLDVYSSKLYLISGNNLSIENIREIGDFISNKLIQRVHIKTFSEYKIDNGMDVIVPSVNLGEVEETQIVEIIEASDDELLEIGKKGILDKKTNLRRGPLALSLLYMKEIQKYFKNVKKRNPTDIELEALAQTWSEHCKHTIFASKIDELEDGLYKGYIKKATNEIRSKLGKDDFCVSVFSDNSGIIKFDDEFYITDKAETHNSPSALDPFGGSITGIVGVNRDTIGCGIGAMPIINTFGFCVADPKSKPNLFRERNKVNPALSPYKILTGVVEGVNVGGNCSGIPTIQGFVNFNDEYRGKPLVFVRTIGLLPKTVNNNDSSKKQAKVGDLIVVVGGRVGKDGIHGATFSSEALDSGSPVSAVQIGDPITQKKLSDAIIKEARDKGLYNSITDNGAGGISCSVAEMAQECGGCEVDIEKIPLKYSGMSNWEIWISESQERITLSIPKENWEEFESLMSKRGVEAVIIGNFTNSGKCIVKRKEEIIMDVDLDFLHDGLPKEELKSFFERKNFFEPKIEDVGLKEFIESMIGRLNVSSIEFIDRQYDHEVGSGSILKPLVGEGELRSETSISRPVLTSKKAIAVSQSLYPRYGEIDTYNMAACAIDSSIKNLVCVGVPYKKIALMDNFCWCSSNEEFRLGQLKRAVKACYDYATDYFAPFISGKDSMFNDFKGFDELNNEIKISAPPTLLISSIGVIDDYEKSISPDLKFEGDLIYILGETKDELGGSEFYSYYGELKEEKGYIGNNVPSVESRINEKLYVSFSKAVENSLISSAIPVNLGGVGVALMKQSIGGDLGCEVDFQEYSKQLSDVSLLFSESSGRILVSINPVNKEEFEETFKDIYFKKIGVVKNKKEILIRTKNGSFNLDLKNLSELYKKPLGEY